MDNIMIDVSNLTKRFKDFTAVDHISFNVKEGEVFGLLGPNGAGKTTTIRMLSTLTSPSAGEAKVGGFDVRHNDGDVRKLIGLVSEKMIMYDRLTAKENLWFFGKLYNIPNQVLNQRIDELLELVKLGKWKTSQVGTFSTGMRQRMNIIRALLNLPKVLFLDEPTLGLDPRSSVEVREFIKKINKEKKITIILTTHMMVEADMLCDRIGIMDNGKIACLNTSTNLKKIVSGANKTIIKVEITNLTTEIIKFIKSLKCVTSVSQDNSTHLKIHATGNEAFDTIIDAIRSKKAKINAIENIQPTLEDVFLHVCGHKVTDKPDKKIPQQSHHRRFMSRPKSRTR